MIIVKITIFMTVLFLILLLLMRVTMSDSTKRKIRQGFNVKLRFIDWLTVISFLFWLLGIVLSTFWFVF